MKLSKSILNELQTWVDQQNLHHAKIRRQKIFEFSLWIVAMGGVIGGYIMFISPTRHITAPVDLRLATWTTSLVFISVIVLAILNRIGADWLARPLFVLLFLLMATFSYTPEQTANGESLVIFTIPIVTSSILLVPWASFVVAGLSSLITAILALSQGVPPNFINMLTFFVLALMIWYSVLSLDRALENLRETNRALKVSEERFRWLTEMSGEYVWQLDLNGRLVYASSSVEKLHGISPQEAVQLHYRDFLPPLEIERVAQVLAKAVSGEEYQLAQFTSKGKDGSLLPVEVSVSPIIQDGVVVGLHGLTRDITELKEAEKALVESQVKLSAIFNNSHDPILVSKAGVFVMVNPAFLRLLGYKDASEVVGRSVLDLAAPESRDMIAENIRRRIKGEPAPEFYEAKALRKDGTKFWVELSLSTYELDGESYVLAVLRDLTERKWAEEKLRRSETLFRAITEQSGEGIALADSDGRYVIVNSAFCRMTGYGEAELLRMKAFELLLPQIEPTLFSTVKSGQPGQREVTLRKKDGTTFLAEIRGYPVRLDGQSCILGITRDVTDRKQAEERERAQRDLAEALSNSAAALNSTLEFTDVLESIENNVGRVVKHDSVGVLLLDETRQIAKIVGYHDVRDRSEKMQDVQFSVSQTRNLREMKTSGEPVIVGDTTQYEGWVHTLSGSWIRDCLGVPIKSKGEIIGFLSLASSTPHTFSPQDAERLQAFVSHAAIAIENARLYEAVQRLAVTDALTGVYNRTFFEAELARMELGRDFPVSIVVADLDNMKITNDQLGHAAGDQLLKHTVQILQKIFRASDIIARIGGDEFAILLPKTNSKTTEQMLTRVRSNLAKHNAVHPNSPIQLSFGASTAEQGNLMKAFVIADQHMYENKAAHKSSNQGTD